MTGRDVVFPKTTKATGTAEFILEHDGNIKLLLHCFVRELEIQL
jgi:hypothetical protein